MKKIYATKTLQKDKLYNEIQESIKTYYKIWVCAIFADFYDAGSIACKLRRREAALRAQSRGLGAQKSKKDLKGL